MSASSTFTARAFKVPVSGAPTEVHIPLHAERVLVFKAMMEALGTQTGMADYLWVEHVRRSVHGGVRRHPSFRGHTRERALPGRAKHARHTRALSRAVRQTVHTAPCEAMSFRRPCQSLTVRMYKIGSPF